MKVIALDIGGSSIKAGTIAKENGFYSKVLYEETVKLNTNEFFELKEKIFDICERLIDSKDVNVIGISTAGSVDNNGIVISAGNFNNYRNISWQDLLSSRFEKVSVTTVNDGRASAWGEYIASGKKANTHVHAVVGTGIGGGVIHKGDLLRGDSGQAGYIGHIKVTPLKTPICSCGKMGCVESLSSARAMATIFNETYASLLEETYDFDKMLESDQFINETMETLKTGGYWLGVALGNVMNILNPQIVTIGGGVILGTQYWTNKNSYNSNPYMDGIKEGIHYSTHRRVEASGEVVFGVLNNSAGLIGAANLAVKNSGLQF